MATSQPGAKLALRDQLSTARNRLGVAEVGAAARGLAEVLLADPEVRRAASVAAYVSIGNEPGTGPLLDGLVAAGKRVILPVLLPDNDLDWAVYAGEGALTRARLGLLEPTGPTLGVDAIGTPDAVLVPGVAVARDGMRLGPRRRVLRPGARHGCPSAPSPACSCTTARSASTSPASPTTGR